MNCPLGNSNRIISIPAVCRLRRSATGATVGTGVLVGPGIILTSRHAVGGTKEEAATCTAVFFEGSKKRVVDVRLLPEKYFFVAAYPDSQDYCLVACDEQPVINITPVTVPLTTRDWTPVCEGDMVLVVQHPFDARASGQAGGDNIGSSADATHGEFGETAIGDGAPVEQKRFEEVLRCRGSLYYLKTDGLLTTAGCPAFNDVGNLIGLQTQRQGGDGEGVVNRILSIVSIVEHMFAMKQLSVLPQQQLVGAAGFDDVWATWFADKDIVRVYAILANFRGKETVRQVTRRLCEMTGKPGSATTLDVSPDGGSTGIILANLGLFPEDEELAELGLRALWNVSVGQDAVLRGIADEGGVLTVVSIMERFPHNEEIIQFGAVTLCNLADAGVDVFSQHRVGERLLVLLLAVVKLYRQSVVLQKFSLDMLTRLLNWQQSAPESAASASFASRIVEGGMLEHAGYLLSHFSRGQIFLVEKTLEFVAELVQDRKAVELIREPERADSVMAADVYGAAPPTAAAAKSEPVRHYTATQLINILIDIMQANVGNDAIMVNGNTALWGLGNVPKFRAAILLNAKSHEVLSLSIPSLVASSSGR